MDDHGYRADLTPLQSLIGALSDVSAEVQDRRGGDAQAIERLSALLTSIEALESAPAMRARLREELPLIIELLQPQGPIVLAPHG